MQRFFLRGKLVMLEGVGHAPHLEAPAEFNRQIERFLADIGFLPCAGDAQGIAR